LKGEIKALATKIFKKNYSRDVRDGAYFVDRDVRVVPVDGPEGEAALLQLRLRVVPLLVDDELLQPREEADLREHAAVFLGINVSYSSIFGPKNGNSDSGANASITCYNANAKKNFTVL
jgi:hypothetical protein